ncbi:MAG: hypothetical protein JXD19_07485, partial [Deltaproteobacteria bacterium]|nr:hypothetical protein [Deltaproteobacteria bacterium]
MNKLKVCAGILLIFILGALAGSFGTRLYLKQKIGEFVRGNRPPLMHMLTRRLSDDLSLTEEQERKVEEIVLQTEEELEVLRQKYHPEFEKTVDRGIDRIKENLSEAQQKELEITHKRLKEHRGGMRHRPDFSPLPPEQMPWSSVRKRLNVTAEQEKEVRPIIEATTRRIYRLIREHREQREQGPPEFRSLREEIEALEESAERELEPLLTEEQMDEYRTMRDEFHRKRRTAFGRHPRR